MKKALVVAGGNVDGIAFEGEYDLVVCADGGYDNATKLGIRCDLFVGDMDSVRLEVECKDKVILPTEKDLTDTEAAIEEAVKRGCKDITLIGALGTRYDHSTANVGLLKKFLLMGVKVMIIDLHNIIEAVNSKAEIRGRVGETLSIIPGDTKVSGISLNGFKYPLENAEIEIGTTLGVSNVITEDIATVSVKKGVLYLIISKD